MSYIALYRKLRPKTFEDVVGQEHIVTTIKNQIISERISHAYLFCGTRGTGKTSTAKIFAKVINCLSPIKGEPCNNCQSCEEINHSTSMNVIEIDAASNNGVENIRELREEVKYSPAKGKYKVYIIDEVHMLSSGAFNALLKTLEEPPSYVVFILATTDHHKIPATILSRCQRFDFKRITVEDMVKRLESYMKTEGIAIEEQALRYIARISDGALRDALSILDQTITFNYNREITLENILEVTGSVDSQVFFDLTDALVKFDSGACVEIIDNLVMNGRDINQFVADYLTHFRNLLIAVNIRTASKALDLSQDNIDKLYSQGKDLEQEILINYINVFAMLQGEIKYSCNERIFLEVACIKLCNPESQNSDKTIFDRIKKLENKLESKISFAESIVVNSKKKSDTLVKKKFDKAIPEDIKDVIKTWRGFVDQFKMPLKGYLANSFSKFLEGEVLVIVSEDPSVSNLLSLKESLVKDGLEKMYKKDFNVSFMSKNEYDTRHKQIYGSVDEDISENKYFTEILGDNIIIDNK